MTAPREIELKLECDGLDLSVLAAHPLLQVAQASEPQILQATYYDTADRDLGGAGLSLRLRREGERWVQTLKAAPAGGIGLFDRSEWEREIDGPSLDRAALAGTPAEAILDGRDLAGLTPLFRTVVERTTRPIRYGASAISATLDAGRVESDLGDAPLCELELELEDGTPADLFALAQALAETVPLRLGALSKGERGDALVGGRLYRPSKAEKLALAPEATTGEAFARIAHACLRHMRLNEAVFVHNRDPEALHQLRVALRRLRSAFTLFKPMLGGDATAQRLRAELKRVTEPFGTARNLDVFLGETLSAEIERRPDEPGLHELRDRLGAQRITAYEAVTAILQSPAWRGLVIDLVTWIEAGPWRSERGVPRRDEPARDFAAWALDRMRRRIKRRGRHLARLEPDARHEVRIEAKKLRYGAEFFGTLFTGRKAPKRHKAFGAALSDLQDHLGAMNDLATAHAIAAGLAEVREGSGGAPVSGAALFAAGLTAADNEAGSAKLLAKAEQAHEDLLEVRPFWR